MKHVGLFAFLGGAIAGAAIAMLITPKRGDEVRDMIKEAVHDGMCRCHHRGQKSAQESAIESAEYETEGLK